MNYIDKLSKLCYNADSQQSMGGEFMWNEMSYNRLPLSFFERLENEPDFDKIVYFNYKDLLNKTYFNETEGEGCS